VPIVALALPGFQFAAMIAISSAFDVGLGNNSVAAANLGALAFVGGAVSVLLTPCGAVCAWAAWHNLGTRPRLFVLVVLAVAVCGSVVFILMYANPFFGVS
jgi:hypothetical protein